MYSGGGFDIFFLANGNCSLGLSTFLREKLVERLKLEEAALD